MNPKIGNGSNDLKGCRLILGNRRGRVGASEGGGVHHTSPVPFTSALGAYRSMIRRISSWPWVSPNCSPTNPHRFSLSTQCTVVCTDTWTWTNFRPKLRSSKGYVHTCHTAKTKQAEFVCKPFFSERFSKRDTFSLCVRVCVCVFAHLLDPLHVNNIKSRNIASMQEGVKETYS